MRERKETSVQFLSKTFNSRMIIIETRAVLNIVKIYSYLGQYRLLRKVFWGEVFVAFIPTVPWQHQTQVFSTKNLLKMAAWP